MFRPFKSQKYLVLLLTCIFCITSAIFCITQNLISVELPLYAQPLTFTESSAATNELNQSQRQYFRSEITVGQGPMAVAINPNTNILYVANSLSNTVSVIDGKTNNILTTITGIKSPQGIAVNPKTNKIYAINPDGKITVIDGGTNHIADYVNAAHNGSVYTINPVGIGVNPVTNTIYAVPPVNHDLAIINGTTNEVNFTGLGFSRANGYQYQIAINFKTNKVYAINPDGNITVIDGLNHRVRSSTLCNLECIW